MAPGFLRDLSLEPISIRAPVLALARPLLWQGKPCVSKAPVREQTHARWRAENKYSQKLTKTEPSVGRVTRDQIPGLF